MNVVVWVVQVLLGLMFLFAGVSKALRPREELRKQMGWVEDFSAGQVKVIGLIEVLGGLGVILPSWTGIAPVLAPIAATGLALDMVLAALVHMRRKEYQMVGVHAARFLLAVFVAVMRFGPYAY